MTQHELRVLYLLRKHGGRAKRMQLSQQMARTPKADRDRALNALEDLELVSSAEVSAKMTKGAGGLVYWLTPAGEAYVDDAIARGELKDPACA